MTTAGTLTGRRNSSTRLFIMVLVSVLLFVALALGEDFGRRLLKNFPFGRAASSSENAVAKAVRLYDQILVQAYDQTSPRLLERIATEQQVRKVRLYMAWNHWEKKQKLQANLRDLTVDSTQRKGRRATAHTTETWDYYYLDEKTGKTVSRETSTYKVRYNLVKVAGDWLIDSLKATKN